MNIYIFHKKKNLKTRLYVNNFAHKYFFYILDINVRKININFDHDADLIKIKNKKKLILSKILLSKILLSIRITEMSVFGLPVKFY